MHQDKSKLVFDNLFDRKFELKSIKNSEYVDILPDDCQIFSELKFSYNKNYQTDKETVVYMGLFEGKLIIFKELENTYLEYRADEYLDIDFCYMNVYYNNHSQIKDEIEKITLQRNKSTFQVYNNDSSELKIWIRFLNHYVVRIDKPHQYQILNALGSGANAEVFKVEKLQSNNFKSKKDKIKLYALKVTNKRSFDDLSRLTMLMKDEISVHRALRQCQSALQLKKVYESNKKIYMLVEYQEGGTLFDLIKDNIQLQEKDLQTIIAQLLLGLDFMHSKNLIHRDIKLDNILLNSNQEGVYEIRLADFGLAKQLQPNEFIYHKCGTPTYIAPEILRDKGYSVKADIFSLGSVMFNLVSGQYLFPHNQQYNLLLANKECDIRHVPSQIKQISAEGQDLLMKLIEPNPAKRLDAKQALNHPWFKKDKEALQEALKINSELSSMTLQKRSFINSSFFRDTKEITKNETEDFNSRQLRNHGTSGLISQSSFFQNKSRFGSQSRNGSKDSKESVNYYSLLQAHRNRPTSQRPAQKVRSKFSEMQFSNKSQESNRSSQKKLRRNRSYFAEEEKNRELVVQKKKSQFMRAIDDSNMQKLVAQNNQVIDLQVSHASGSENSIHDLKDKNLLDEWNVSDYDADEQIEQTREITEISDTIGSSRSKKFLQNKSATQVRRIFFDSNNIQE
ncbi:serine threonine protein kinase [Stylonychia lemnae]|uniref:Serine threonine protein kinase n=1 Tax=Stylonychia lemnae TaxID=5949 RepID=A0A078B297_STYLE|nr:serine threonine protein kinase [Stylonychia lemnae]|eukprot:CDW87583.1 serine threonine protein kinase [Stylonychia lemnae]